MFDSTLFARWWVVPVALLLLLGASACGGGADESAPLASASTESERLMPAAPAPAQPAAMAVSDAPVRGERSASQAAGAPGLPGRPGPPGAPAAPAAAAKLAAVAESVESAASSDQQVAQLVTQQRIIIRTVDMGVEVDDVGAAIDDIGELGKRMGGWVVSSNRPLMHTGSVSIRVPADMLDQAVLEIRALSLRVQYESSDSRDVTDEYVDLSSRLKNTMATEEALLKLLERAEKVDDALAVQSNLSRVQEDVERLQGRIKYLEQTSAFSLLNVSLSEEPREMVPDAGPDVRAGVGEPIRFRATFTPPDGIESFDYTWDFGDGTQVVSGNRTAPTGDGTRRVTATVHHRYDDERDSPYIVQFNITGFGDGGLSEGEDTLIATVSRIPNIEVFAGEWTEAEEGETVELSGSFTRPAGMSDMRYTWDFGDGSSPATGSLEEGVTTVGRRPHLRELPAPIVHREAHNHRHDGDRGGRGFQHGGRACEGGPGLGDRRLELRGPVEDRGPDAIGSRCRRADRLDMAAGLQPHHRRDRGSGDLPGEAGRLLRRKAGGAGW